MVHRIENFHHDFLWNDTIEKRKYHLVRWNIVSKTIAQGDLAVHSIDKVNLALLGKWLVETRILSHVTELFKRNFLVSRNEETEKKTLHSMGRCDHITSFTY